MSAPELWFSWQTIMGVVHRGLVTEVDSNTIHMICDDGVKRATEGTREECDHLRAVLARIAEGEK
jgi:hypothetical protein